MEESKRQKGALKRVFKDSAFSKLFSNAEVIAEELHSLEERWKDVRAEDIQILKTETLLVNGLTNDLVFMVHVKVGNAEIGFVEAQTKWSYHILLRMDEYYWERLKERMLADGTYEKLFDTKLVEIPVPYFYVVYCGKEIKDLPPEISLAKDFFHQEGAPDLRAKVISHADDTPFGNYIGFCRCVDEGIRQARNIGSKGYYPILEKAWSFFTNPVLRKQADFYKEEMMELFASEYKEEFLNQIAESLFTEKGIEIGEERGIQIGEERGIQIGEERGIQIGEDNVISNLIKRFHALGKADALIAEELQVTLLRVRKVLQSE